MRTRPLKPSFFKNDDIAELPFGARLLLQGLWTIADRAGRLEYRPKKIRGEIFPHDSLPLEQIEQWLSEIQAKKLIEIYEVKSRKFIQVPNFAKHARPHKDEPIDDSIPTAPRKTDDLPATSEAAGKTSGEPGKLPASCPVSCLPIAVSCLPSPDCCPAESEDKPVVVETPISPPKKTNEEPSAWLARCWMMQRKGAHTQHDRQAADNFTDLLSAGVDCGAIEREINRRDRPKTEPIWDFQKRMMPGKTKYGNPVGPSRVEVAPSEIERRRQKRAAEEAARSGEMGVEKAPPRAGPATGSDTGAA